MNGTNGANRRVLLKSALHIRMDCLTSLPVNVDRKVETVARANDRHTFMVLFNCGPGDFDTMRFKRCP